MVPDRRLGGRGGDELIDVRLRNLLARLVELRAQPAHDPGQVWQLALLDVSEHALIPAGAFLGLEHAVDPTGLGHVRLPLLPPNSPCAHDPVSSTFCPSRWLDWSFRE